MYIEMFFPVSVLIVFYITSLTVNKYCTVTKHRSHEFKTICSFIIISLFIVLSSLFDILSVTFAFFPDSYIGRGNSSHRH